MPDYDKIVRERQKAIRRQIDARKIAIKAIQLDAGWEHPSTVLSYFPADSAKDPAVMSVAALFRLIDRNALPAELLSVLLPDGYQIVRAPAEIDHDEIADALTDYLHEKNAAHHPESEAGRDLGPTETARLNAKVVQLPIAKVA